MTSAPTTLVPVQSATPAIAPVLGAGIVTLEDMIAFVAKQGIDDAKIWAHLDTTDGNQLLSLLDELELVDGEKYDAVVHAPLKQRQFLANQSARKGKLFEQISKMLLAGVRCFKVHSDITSSTNQLDLLVQLNPSSSIIPALRDWGEYFICECKFHDKGIDNGWLHKLRSILDTHRAKVGILIAKKGLSKTGRAGNQHHLIQLMAAQDRYLLVFSRAELRNLAKQGKVLENIIEKFTTTKLGVSALMRE